MATKAQRNAFQNTANGHQRAVVELLEELACRNGMARAFSDFVEVCAIVLSKADLQASDRREARYLEVIKGYSRDDLERFVAAFAHLQMAFQACFSATDEASAPLPYSVAFADILGQIYMMLDMGNAGTGQFFTPYPVSLLMAQMLTDGCADQVARGEFIRLQEPACGAGGMVLAQAQALSDRGINYQVHMHAHLIDVDRTCVHMAFVQLSLACVPAEILHGNALNGEVWDRWYTPIHVLGGWSARLRFNRAREALSVPATQARPEGEAARRAAPEPAPVPAAFQHARTGPAPAPRDQLALF
ncbi:N-6 DNA methylase [Achromobacter ruhlandii]|uniref:N-6 DNA methylase n=1 Tax=Achromobacter ruhlandii TaxID=72557 RepID=UPI003B9FFC91